MTAAAFTLDDALAALADEGLLSHLSVARTSEGLWQASFRVKEGTHYNVAVNENVLAAIYEALEPDGGLTLAEIVDEPLEDVL